MAHGSPKHFLFTTAAILLAGFIGLVAAEVAGRLAGYGPYSAPDFRTRVEPGGRYRQAHPTLGFAHLPGTFLFTQPSGHQYRVTHLPDGLRITRPLEEYGKDNVGPREEIWLFGCSYVYGWGLNDSETMGWKLQKRLPEFEFRNFGISGYSTWQSLLQFREAFETRTKPRVVVYAYAEFHDERNTMARRWRRALERVKQFGTLTRPFVRLNGSGELQPGWYTGDYWEMPGARSLAVLHGIDRAWMKAEQWMLQSHEVSRLLVQQFASEAAAHQVRFLLAGIRDSDGTTEMLEWAKKNGIATAAIGVDHSKPEFKIAGDGHPSDLATDHFADMLSPRIGDLTH